MKKILILIFFSALFSAKAKADFVIEGKTFSTSSNSNFITFNFNKTATYSNGVKEFTLNIHIENNTDIIAEGYDQCGTTKFKFQFLNGFLVLTKFLDCGQVTSPYIVFFSRDF